MRSRRWVIVGGAFVAGVAIGGTAGLAARSGSGTRPVPMAPPARLPSGQPSSPSPSGTSRDVVPDTLLAWTPGRLPQGFSRKVAALRGVTRAVAVVSGTAWLTRSYAASGAVVDRPPPGLAIPIEVAAAGLRTYAPFLSPGDRAVLPDLARGQGVLGTTSAELRRLGAGGVLRLGSRRIRIAGVVPDAEIGAHELFVSSDTAKRLGIVRPRYLLIDPRAGVGRSSLVARIRGLLPQGIPLRIRGPGETPFFRMGDAVLPPVILKERFGEFAARVAPDGSLLVDPRWEATHIVDAAVPILGHVRCNRGIIPQLRGALHEIVQDGLSQLIDPSEYEGCYVPKFIGTDPQSGISHHTWGVAFDINVAQNVFGHTPHLDPRLVSIFERWGFVWGGRWLVPDGMHFEYLRSSSGN